VLGDPPILVLDDATSAIDVELESRIHARLRERGTGCTMILVAHRLSTIGLADKVALLDEGRIVAVGTHAELLRTDPRYGDVLAVLDDDGEADEPILAGATSS
jgi:ATP-binding cassette subfamily B protein